MPMKRFHVHLSVADLGDSIRYYTSLFGAEPTVSKPDYAKWMLDDPRVNFAISQRGAKPGLDHLGFQVESDEELAQINERLGAAELPSVEETGAACCYVRSNKYWSVDPQGVAWEGFHSLSDIPTFNEAEDSGATACCAPKAQAQQAGGGCC
jgi:catechol 2,3-dioxygenase-like lactoylglutathione lyase family enzyme